MAAILTVEDDLMLRRDLKILLERKGYEVTGASGLKEARILLKNGFRPSLVLLDVWLPDGDGFELIQEIRERSTAPVLFLTACDDEASVIRGLDLGADDYITKPFREAELISRIQANLRREEMRQNPRILTCRHLTLDTKTHGVRLKDETVNLRPAEYRLLEIFINHPGLLLSREKILDLLQEETMDDPVEDNTLSVHVSRLRRKIGNEYIETVRSFGYRFLNTQEGMKR